MSMHLTSSNKNNRIVLTIIFITGKKDLLRHWKYNNPDTSIHVLNMLFLCNTSYTL